jgi:NADH dehydrogenase/NADH:ubiquinone oxidoreductase subunit G
MVLQGEESPERGSRVNIEVTLNKVEVAGRPGMTILELARTNHVDVPTLCYHPDLRPIGMCRICVVEVEGSRTLLPACETLIAPGMVIQTHSPRVMETRKTLVELMLASHPDVCLVCDKGNDCELRRIAGDLAITMPRFRMKRHYYPSEDAGPHVVRDLTKCILCRRCVRACHEIKKADILAMGYQGFRSKVVAGRDEPLDADVCQSCNVCISVCPVGALAIRKGSAHGSCGQAVRTIH